MRFVLFMESLNQDYPGVTDYRLIRSEDYRRLVKDWDLQWDKPWPKDATPCGSGGIAYVPREPLERFCDVFTRRESFGGLLYDPSTGCIYKLDVEAFQVIESLRASDDLAKLQAAPIDEAARELAGKRKGKAEDIAYLLHDLRSRGLW